MPGALAGIVGGIWEDGIFWSDIVLEGICPGVGVVGIAAGADAGCVLLAGICDFFRLIALSCSVVILPDVLLCLLIGLLW